MIEEPVPDHTVGDDGYFAGPVHVLAVRNTLSNVRRLWGPIVNEIFTGAWTDDSTRLRTDPDDASYHWIGETWCARPIPVGLAQVRVRIQVQIDGDTVYRFRAHAAAGDPQFAHVQREVSSFVAVSTHHGSGTTGGEWIEFDPLPVLKDGKGLGRFWISAFELEETSFVTPFRIRAMIVDAYA